MSINPSGVSYSWNYNKPEQADYSLEFYGTVLAIQEVQAREWTGNGQPGKPRTWPDGNPVMNIRVAFATPNGTVRSITFGKAGKKQQNREKPSLHMQLFDISGGNMDNLVGKTVHLWTWNEHPGADAALGFYTDADGNVVPNPWNNDTLKGRSWGQGNPRLFGAEEVADVTYALTGNNTLPDDFKVAQLYCNDGAQGGQPIAPAPQQVQVPQMPPMQGQFYAPPQVQQQVYQQPMQQQPVYAQQPMQQQVPMQQQMPMQQQVPMQQQMYPQPVRQPVATPMAPGMDPAVAAAMQAVGAVNVQAVDETGGVYDQDIPF